MKEVKDHQILLKASIESKIRDMSIAKEGIEKILSEGDELVIDSRDFKDAESQIASDDARWEEDLNKLKGKMEILAEKVK